MENNEFIIEEEDVEFDEDLYLQNCIDNDFSAWDDEIGKGDDE